MRLPLAILLAILPIFQSVAAGDKTPINKGLLQGNLDGGTYGITNLNQLVITNSGGGLVTISNGIITASGAINATATNAAHATNADIATLAPTYTPTNNGVLFNATVSGNVVNSNQALAVVSGPGRGGVQNSSTPDILTSAANIIDMPPRGNEIWANQKKPMVVITSRMGPIGIGSSNNLQNCTENNMVLALQSFQTNGLLGFTTNLGIRAAYQAEDGALTNHRDANQLLRWNTNRWPSATINPTNATRIARTNNVEFFWMMYADTVNPTNGNTECDLNPVSGANNYWHYPNGVNNLGAVEIQPLITGNSVTKDVATFYAWGVRGLTIQDGGDNYQFMGFQDGVQRKLAYASLHPYYEVWDATSPVFIQGNFQSWQNLDGVFPFSPNQHGMILNYLISTPTYYWPGEVEYNANGVCFGSGGQSTEPSGSGVLGQTASNIRPQIRFYTNLLSGTIHPIWQSDNLTDMQLWGPTDWKNHLALIAMFNSDLELTAPQQSYFSNAAFSVNYTNICTNGIWMDDAQNRVIVISLGVTNGIFAKRLVDPNKVAVAMFNMGTQGATNLTVQFSAFGWATNTYAVAIDNFTNSNRGQFSNSMTLSVGSTNVEWVTLERKESFSGVNPFVVTNNTPGLVGASAILTLGINTNQLSISSEGISVGASLSGLALFEIHTPPTGAKTNAYDIDDQYLLYRHKGDGGLYINGLQSGANFIAFDGVNGKYGVFSATACSLTNIATYCTNTVINGSISANGWTNTTGVNMNLNMTGTTITFEFYNRAGRGVFTNSSVAATTVPVPCGAGVRITAGSGMTFQAYAQ